MTRSSTTLLLALALSLGACAADDGEQAAHYALNPPDTGPDASGGSDASGGADSSADSGDASTCSTSSIGLTECGCISAGNIKPKMNGVSLLTDGYLNPYTSITGDMTVENTSATDSMVISHCYTSPDSVCSHMMEDFDAKPAGFWSGRCWNVNKNATTTIPRAQLTANCVYEFVDGRCP